MLSFARINVVVARIWGDQLPPPDPPSRTPMVAMVDQSERVLLIRTQLDVSVYSCSSTRTILGEMPMERRMCPRQSRSTYCLGGQLKKTGYLENRKLCVYKFVIYPIICLKSVDVRRLQVAILARSPREMSQTDRILPRYFLSRVRVSVRPRIF